MVVHVALSLLVLLLRLSFQCVKYFMAESLSQGRGLACTTATQGICLFIIMTLMLGTVSCFIYVTNTTASTTTPGLASLVEGNVLGDRGSQHNLAMSCSCSVDVVADSLISSASIRQLVLKSTLCESILFV